MKFVSNQKILFIVAILLLMINSCNKDDSVFNSLIIKEKISGVIQKGPYLNGTSISFFELKESLEQTGNVFSTQINNNQGAFELSDIELASRYVELKADGFYFNEVTGKNSTAPLELYAISDIKEKNTLNINLLTNIERSRVKYLTQNDIPFQAAKDSAQKEILSIFGWEAIQIDNSELLDISKSNEGNAILLALSVILQQNLSVADLSELLANMNTDIGKDGILHNEKIVSSVYMAAQKLDLKKIRTNLETRYKNLGIDAVIPDFESKINTYLDNRKLLNVDMDAKPVTTNGGNDGAINISVSGGTPPYIIECSNGDTKSHISGLYSGLYTVKVTDAHLHERTDDVIIGQPLVYSYTKTDVTCNGKYDGAINITVSGGVEPYKYIWSNGSSSEDINQLAVGSYIVTIEDGAYGFQIKDTIIITEPEVLVFAATKSDVSEENNSDGEINITVSGGVTPYSYNWSNGEITEDLYNIPAGKYTVKTIDSNSCAIENTVYIDVPYTVTDIDGNVYRTVVIGTQEWMAENLRTTRYNDGTSIPLATDTYTWIRGTDAAYGWYNYDESTAIANEYGALYNWYAVETEKLCPTGWHVPTDTEWTDLEDYITDQGHENNEGTVLKATTGWGADANATDNYGFSALPGGMKHSSSSAFYSAGRYGWWWSSTRIGNHAYTRHLFSPYIHVYRPEIYIRTGISVRCIKD